MASAFAPWEPVDFLAMLGETGHADLAGGRRAQRRGSIWELRRSPFQSEVIDTGLVRAYQVADDGREATTGYLYAHEYAGSLPALGPRPVVFLQAIEETTLRELDGRRLRALLETDAELARALAVHVATILGRVVRVVTVRTLGTVKQRVAFDLVERLCDGLLGDGDLTCQVTQQDLADSIGSAREVVGRALAELRRDGIVSTHPGAVTVHEVARLVGVVDGLLT